MRTGEVVQFGDLVIVSIDDLSSVQFSGHETFPLRHGWLTKATAEIYKNSTDNRGIFSDADAIVRFGVGKNMVNSIRHWATATQIIENQNNTWKVTELGDFLFGERGVDVYAETHSTLWLLHWKLCSTPNKSTTWYWVFNQLLEDKFEKHDLMSSLMTFCADKKISRTSDKTIENDVTCFIGCYAKKRGKAAGDDLESALGDLNIIQPIKNGSRYVLQKGDKPTLHSAIFNFCLYEYIKSSGSSNTISVDKIVYGEGSPGRVFKLDEQSAVSRLVDIAETSNGVFEWSETAGLRQVALVNEPSSSIELLRPAFEI